VLGGAKKRGRIVYSRPVRIKTITYDGIARRVTLTLAKPHNGAIQVTVHGGIVAANGASSRGDFTAVVK
jgi:hypothetical protein